jgi:hypothetical protein
MLVGAILWLALLLFIVLKRVFFRSDRSVEQTAFDLTNIHSEFLRYVRTNRGSEFFRTRPDKDGAHELQNPHELQKMYRDFLRRIRILHPLQSLQRSRELACFAICYREFVDYLDRSEFFSHEVDEEMLHEEFQRFLERDPQLWLLAFSVVGTLVLSTQFAVAASPAVLVLGGLLVNSLYWEREVPGRRAAYWNTWFQDSRGLTPAVLRAGNRYSFLLDLSPYEYALVRRSNVAQSVAADPSMQELLATSDAKEIMLIVRPMIPQGSGLKFLRPAGVMQLPVDVDKLRQESQESSEDVRRYAAGELTLPQFAERVGAGHIPGFDVIAETPGCSAIVLSIWTDNAKLPLDHLIRWVGISREGQPDPTCDDFSGNPRQLMSGGLNSLLQTSFAVDAGAAAQTADAAFHVFHSKAGSFVVFVDGRENAVPRIRAWQMKSDLAKYLGNKIGLPTMIAAARKDATNGEHGSYVRSAQELAKTLFDGEGDGEAEAEDAEATFKQIVKESRHTPVVVAKVVSDQLVAGQNRTFFLPLGILGAKGDGAVLAKPIAVVQPLPRERYGSKSTCIGEWTFGIPKNLEKLGDLTERFAIQPPGARIQSLEGLKSYLSDRSAPGTSPAQGFLLLAHHEGGFLWYDKQDERVTRDDNRRRYPPGSVAIFAACSTTVPTDGNAVLLQDFNAHGMDALIASPFPVPADYGAQLAATFADLIRKERYEGHTPTVAELFTTAVARTATYFADSQYEEMGLEYVLLGDPSLRLCKAIPEETKP